MKNGKVLTCALVLRASDAEISALYDYLERGNYKIVYRTVSVGPLYVSRNEPDDDTK